jgi:hypothetical protein
MTRTENELLGPFEELDEERGEEIRGELLREHDRRISAALEAELEREPAEEAGP